MFGTYVKPAGVTIAETHGIKETPFVPGPDASIRGLSGDYRTTRVGLALRWFKQLAMRRCARELNENRASRPMRLLFHKPTTPILEHWGRMSPAAPSPETLFVEDKSQLPRRRLKTQVNSNDLLVFLLSSKETTVFASDIAEATRIKLKEALRTLKNDESFWTTCEQHGWEVHPRTR